MPVPEDNEDRLELFLASAKAHGDDAGSEYEIGDLQYALYAAFELLSPEQQVAFFDDERVASVLENEGEDSDHEGLGGGAAYMHSDYPD